MAKKKSFYEQPVDRTPYGACVWVAVLIVALFGIGAFAVLRLGGLVNHRVSGSFKLPSVNTQNIQDTVRSAADAQSQQIHQQLQDEIQKQQDAAASAAAQAVKDEAQKQINQATQGYGQ